MSCGSNPSGGISAQNQRQQNLTNQSVSAINSAFGGFTPQFFGNRIQAYENYALPQLAQQYRQNQQGLNYALGNRGLLSSSDALRGNQVLQQANTLGTQQIGNQAISQAQGLQQQIAGQQANLIGQAQTATSPTALGQQALTTAAGFNQPSTFAPIGNLFNTFDNQYLANQTQNTFSPYQNPFLYASPYFQGGGGSGGSNSIGIFNS